MLETYMRLGVTEPGFLEKCFLSPKSGKWTKNGLRKGFFQFVKKFGINVYWIFTENLYYLLCSWKIFVPEIGTKIFWANQIAEFFNQAYLQTNQWNSLIFCMLIQIYIKVDQNFLGWTWSKMSVTFLITAF